MLQRAAGPGSLAGSPAAGQLVSLLGRPEVLQALLAMTMQPIGRQAVPVAGTQVPVAAFGNLIGSLAQQAVEETRGVERNGGTPHAEYLKDNSGNYRCDPANAEERAAVLWEMLQTTAPAESLSPFATAIEGFESAESQEQEADEAELFEMEATDDEFYDALELAELAQAELATVNESYMDA